MNNKIKLKESIPSNTIKIIDLYNKIESELLDTSPNFQRKLVWKKQHKFAFINTILLNFPFPEIYIASSEIDVNNMSAKEIVVDGQQRLNSIVDYIKGINDFADQTKIKSFDSLSIQEKKDFLNYPVSVKDLKDLPQDTIKEIFRRINSTDYSLNANEIINAQYGGGEFAVFCKQIADSEYKVSEDETDVLISPEARSILTDFFHKNKVFTENDVKRMFDSQYLMLIVSTILEGKYFGRNTRINHYLEKYNLEFTNYNNILTLIIKSVNVISSLKLSEESYWFNKANLFTLIIEISKIDTDIIDKEILEKDLVNLESKVDLYFNGDENEIKLLSPDEAKYFEVSRQGSNELAAREHRGKVVRNILQHSIADNTAQKCHSSLLIKNCDNLHNSHIEFSTLTPTDTGLSKNIMDATLTLRDFLKKKKVHDYSTQKFGPTNKIKKIGQFILEDFSEQSTEMSLYRSNGRGDFRIWLTDLKDFAASNDTLGVIIENDKIAILNLSKYDYTNFIHNLQNNC